jgi:hypothetical protein
MNLLQETIYILNENGKSLNDIEWIGNREYTIPKDLFTKLANTEYDSGYGCSEVAEDLIIVGEYWWLERHEYDGAEWWEYKEQPKKPKKERIIQKLITNSCSETLTEINNESGDV